MDGLEHGPSKRIASFFDVLLGHEGHGHQHKQCGVTMLGSNISTRTACNPIFAVRCRYVVRMIDF